MTTIENLLELLALHGGSIVSTASLKPNEINQARASERMYVDSNSLGFVWMPKIEWFPTTIEEVWMPKIEWFPTTIEEVKQFEKWFPTTIEEVKQFEKWFPLDEELPDELKNLDWFYKREAVRRQSN